MNLSIGTIGKDLITNYANERESVVQAGELHMARSEYDFFGTASGSFWRYNCLGVPFTKSTSPTEAVGVIAAYEEIRVHSRNS